MIMVPNLEAKYSIGSAISTEFIILRQPLTTLLLMVWRKHSTRQLSSYSRNSFRPVNEIEMKACEYLWAYRTTVRTPTGNTSFSLVYECETVIPLEIQMPSLRVALANKMTKEDNDRLRLQELEALYEKRLQAQQHIELYQAQISKAFNKKIKKRGIPERRFSFSRQMTHNNDTQNQRQISAQIERTAHNRSSLFEWSIPPYNPKQ